MTNVRLLRLPDAYAVMPDGRKGHNVAPTKAQFRELQRLLALVMEANDALANRIGHHLPVAFVDRITRFTHWKTLAMVRSKLDTWACKSDRGTAAMDVFYGDEDARKRAKALIAALLAEPKETLPPGFMGAE